MFRDKKILFITLSNIGDAILTLPALDYILASYPEAKVTVMTSRRPRELFLGNPRIEKVITFDKHSPLKEKIRLFNKLRQERFDVVVDLKNTLFGALLPARFRILPPVHVPSSIRHMSQRHLHKITSRLGAAGLSSGKGLSAPKDSLRISQEDRDFIEKIREKHHLKSGDSVIAISAGARSHTKRWPKENFIQLCLKFLSLGYKVILVGDVQDQPVARAIEEGCGNKVINLCGQTSLTQLAALLQKCRLLVTNDSAVLHLASYLDIPVVAVFGPTNEEKYGPWSSHSAVAKKEIFCRPCEKAQCRFSTLECLKLVRPEEVMRQVECVLHSAERRAQSVERRAPDVKRILVVRTDRIGDVLLSTPVIKNLRDAYPCAYIAMMVSPYAKDIVEGNPYLDQVIIYDKDGKHKSWLSSMRFARNLKKKRFDLALILHPTNRAHLITFFAGIRRRVGYNLKMGFLLTDRLTHAKHLGQKHELEYSLDLLRHIGIEPKDKSLFMPIRPESEEWFKEFCIKEKIRPQDELFAIHPGASCPSKVWPNERFAEVADALVSRYNFKALIVSGPKDTRLAQEVLKNMRQPALDLAAKTSVSQLASILKRCRLFISNDSGPVHIASALGIPVVSIFGRAQAGLGPKRWGPTGSQDKVLHKEVGCIECLAHNCKKRFACLKAITSGDVLEAAESIIKQKS